MSDTRKYLYISYTELLQGYRLIGNNVSYSAEAVETARKRDAPLPGDSLGHCGVPEPSAMQLIVVAQQ